MADEPVVALIAAIARNGAIGLRGQMPWHLSTDMKRFRTLTWGKPLIMGRRTFDSIGKPLPGRETVVITRNPDFKAEGVRSAGSVDEAIAIARELAKASGAEEIFIAGGAEIYAAALPTATRFYKTEVHLEPEADVFFPALDVGWTETAREAVPASPRDDAEMTFLILERTRA